MGKLVVDFEIEEYLVGIFIKEMKNRFRCLVNVNGENTVCYIPSSCRLSNFIDLSNRKVLLQPIKTVTSKMKYSVFAAKYGKNYILLNLSMANRIIEEQLGRRYFSFLGKRKNVAHEVSVNGYKSDLYIRDTNTIIEVKTIISTKGEAVFPSVYSERANKQLTDILRLLNEGYGVCYIFVSLNPYVRSIDINEALTEYYNLFCKCVLNGMIYCGFSIRFKNEKPILRSKIPVELKWDRFNTDYSE